MEGLHQILRDRMSAGARVQDPAGLAELARLDALMGHPGQGATIVQVVGTNGKGSTSSLLAHLVRQGGQRVGLFSSPHLYRVNERIRVDDELIGDKALYRICEDIAQKEAALGIALTFFELLTMAALAYFEQTQVPVIVLEAGLGGRLDSTRVRQSHLTLVTPIAMDHQSYLGPTLSHIAREKAAVIHSGAPALTVDQEPEAMSCIQEQAQAVGTTLQIVSPLQTKLEGLGADYQRTNAALAIAGAAALRSLQGLAAQTPSEDAFRNWRWPGRLEASADPRGGGVLWDVAHNPHAVNALIQSLAQDPRELSRVYWYSAADKDQSKIRDLLGSLKVPIFELSLDDPELAQPHTRQALEQIENDLAQGRWVLVVGSHRLMSALRPGQRPDGLVDPIKR